MGKLDNMSIGELYSLKSAAKSICDDYAEMATTYSLVHGNKTFDELHDDEKEIIRERQLFYGYVQKINNKLKEKFKEVLEDD